MGKKKGTGMTRRQFCGASLIGSVYLANTDTIAMAAAEKKAGRNECRYCGHRRRSKGPKGDDKAIQLLL